MLRTGRRLVASTFVLATAAPAFAGAGSGGQTLSARGALVVTVEPGPAIDDVLVSRPWIVRAYRPSDALPAGWEVALSTRADGTDPGPPRPPGRVRARLSTHRRQLPPDVDRAP